VSRLPAVFANAKRDARKLLIPYVTAGDPNPAATVPIMHVLVEAGADILEIGVPFSDPMADGPVIQAACERALAQGASLRVILDLIKTFRQTNSRTPVVLMGYLNPVEAMGYPRFADMAAAAGVDAVLLVDLTPEESADLEPLLRAKGLDSVYLVAPTTTKIRLQEILTHASGYLYYVSLKGVTGADRLDIASVEQKVGHIRRQTQLPIAVGFGIRDAESAARVAGIADAVIVGSALVSLIGQEGHDLNSAIRKISGLLATMRQALDAA